MILRQLCAAIAMFYDRAIAAEHEFLFFSLI